MAHTGWEERGREGEKARGSEGEGGEREKPEPCSPRSVPPAVPQGGAS